MVILSKTCHSNSIVINQEYFAFKKRNSALKGMFCGSLLDVAF